MTEDHKKRTKRPTDEIARDLRDRLRRIEWKDAAKAVKLIEEAAGMLMQAEALVRPKLHGVADAVITLSQTAARHRDAISSAINTSVEDTGK